MADLNRYNILYKPRLEPQRGYRSEATFQKDATIPVVLQTTPPDSIDQLVEQWKQLEDLAPALPEGLDFITESISKFRQRAEVIQQEIPLYESLPIPEDQNSGPYNPSEKVNNAIDIGTNVLEEQPSIPGVPSMFPKPTNITLEVETPQTLVQIAQEAYQRDQIDLQKYYLQQTKRALQRYFQHMLAIMAELSLSDIDTLTRNYDSKYVTGIPANDQHLHDTIIRSQIQKDQKARFFKKMANTDQTLMHMRKWQAAEKERERYYAEAYINSETYLGSESNAQLRQNRAEYDIAYRQAVSDMYKYLDSSVKDMSEILDHTLLEAKCKGKLAADGVDIFATRTPKVVTGTSTTQPSYGGSTTSSSDSSSTTMTAEEIDKANGITDPATDYPLAPNGGHYSKNDIEYLANKGYNRDEIIRALSMHIKYASAEEEESAEDTLKNAINANKTKQKSENTDTGSQVVESEGDSTKTESKEKVDTIINTGTVTHEDGSVTSSATATPEDGVSGAGAYLATLAGKQITSITVEGTTYAIRGLTPEYIGMASGKPHIKFGVGATPSDVNYIDVQLKKGSFTIGGYDNPNSWISLDKYIQQMQKDGCSAKVQTLAKKMYQIACNTITQSLGG